MTRTFLSTALIVALMVVVAGSAMAAPIGTTSQDTIYNGVFNSGDTIPNQKGELTVAYRKSSTNADSNYKGPTAIVSVVVDTGYDIATIGSPADKSGGIGDTVSFAYGVTNLSNATITVYVDSIYHPLGQSDSGPGNYASTNWDISGSYKFYYDLDNNGLWLTGDTQITSLIIPSGANDTIIAVVLIPADANNGETTTTFVHVSDRAPRNLAGTTTGDGWQDSTVKANDSRDTQYDTTVTRVAGPNIFVSKTLAELTSTNSRPGDTLVINITYDNDGDDSGRGVEILDAVPSNTKLVRNSADSVALPTQYGHTGANWDTAFVVQYDTDAVGSGGYDFKDTFVPVGQDTGALSKRVSVVKWVLKDLVGANGGDASATVNYDQTKNDNGRVEFRVVID